MKRNIPSAAAILSLASFFVSSSALASDPDGPDLAVVATPATVATPALPTEPLAPAMRRTTWYGYQPLVGDMVATTLTTAGVIKALSEIGPINLCGTFSAREDCPRDPPRDHGVSTALLASGVITYAFASPTIHAIHGHWNKAAASLGLRAAPIALALPLMASGSDDVQRVGAGVLLVGVVAAILIDDVLIAREPPKDKATARALSIGPTFDAKNGGGGVAAAGTF